MSFLLDTDTCIHVINDTGGTRRRMLSKRRNEVWVSSLSVAELLAGAAKSGSPTRNRHTIEAFLTPLTLIDFTVADAAAYAEVRARLEKNGQLIGPIDLLLAAQAIGRDLTLVTNNLRELRRVTGLAVASWAA